MLYRLSKNQLLYRTTVSNEWYCTSTSKIVNICYVDKKVTEQNCNNTTKRSRHYNIGPKIDNTIKLHILRVWQKWRQYISYWFIVKTLQGTLHTQIVWHLNTSPLGPESECPNHTRNSSGDEIANVNFLYDDTVHALENTIDSCINFHHRLLSATQVYQIQWNNAMKRPLRRSRSFKVTDFGTNRKHIYDFLLVINTNLPPIMHRFQVMADYWSNFH